jgi:hypothetical protein
VVLDSFRVLEGLLERDKGAITVVHAYKKDKTSFYERELNLIEYTSLSNLFVNSKQLFSLICCTAVLNKYNKNYDVLAIFCDVDSWCVVSIFYIVHEFPHAARNNVQPY